VTAEPTADLETAVADFAAVRPRLFGIAYRMLGSVAEAEDVVQDAWLRWQGTDRSAVRDVAAFLATTTTRLAINVATSARVSRESYIGPWIPEPVDTSADPQLGAERGEALELAVLMMLEKLPATERAAYVLREAFDYPYRQIAEVLETSEANARQLASRARTHLTEERRSVVERHEHQRLLSAFVAAASSGDLEGLERLLAADAISYSDGGGVVFAARKAVVGRSRVALFIANIAAKNLVGASASFVEANGQTGVLVRAGDGSVVFVSVEVTEDGISRVLFVLNPAKLQLASGDGWGL